MNEATDILPPPDRPSSAPPGSAITSTARSVRYHSIRLLRQIADSLEERQALDERADILDIAGPRESALLESLLRFLESADAIEDEDLFAVTALMEARQLWPNNKALPEGGANQL
jgi:hypothetical protein